MHVYTPTQVLAIVFAKIKVDKQYVSLANLLSEFFLFLSLTPVLQGFMNNLSLQILCYVYRYGLLQYSTGAMFTYSKILYISWN